MFHQIFLEKSSHPCKNKAVAVLAKVNKIINPFEWKQGNIEQMALMGSVSIPAYLFSYRNPLDRERSLDTQETRFFFGDFRAREEKFIMKGEILFVMTTKSFNCRSFSRRSQPASSRLIIYCRRMEINEYLRTCPPGCEASYERPRINSNLGSLVVQPENGRPRWYLAKLGQ